MRTGDVGRSGPPARVSAGAGRPAGRVLVTGATGFVGGHAVEALLEEGLAVRAFVRATSDVTLLESLGVERVVGSFTEPASLRAAVAGCDVVLHLAAATAARGEAEFVRANVQATRALVAAMLEAEPRPRRLVYMSSMAAAGPSSGRRAVRPGDEPAPITAYGRSKLAGERAALEAADALRVVAVRAPAVYGPRDRDLYLYFRLAELGLQPVPAGPERWVHVIHVRDLARALARAATAPRAVGIYQVADPVPYRWSEVADQIGAAVGTRPLRVTLPQSLIRVAAGAVEAGGALVGRAPIFNRDKARELLAPGWLCDTEAAREELGWEPEHDLTSGLADTAAWYRAYGWLRRGPDGPNR